jgi:AraC-like DNA-binding protein
MNLLASASSLVIGIAAVLTFYTALLHLSRSNITNGIKFRVVRGVAVGLQTLQLFFIAQDVQFEQPWVLYPLITLLFISGPLNYIRYFMFFYPGEKIPRWIKAQFIPAAFILAGETWFYFVRWNESQSEIIGAFHDPTHHLIASVILAGFGVHLIQYLMLLKLELGFLNIPRIREPVLISSILTAMTMADNVLITIGFMLASPILMDVGILLLGLTGIIYLLFENRYPSFYQLIAQEERQKKYKKSLLKGLSQDKIMDRLEKLMEEEKIFRTLELKLDDVAALLLITPHQLSEFINESMGMNFSSYVSRYRVEDAKDLLLHNPDMNTLSICFQVGFGSKQSFNTIFKQHTGMTPSEYRKKAQNFNF